jgi:rare lipoprotein A
LRADRPLRDVVVKILGKQTEVSMARSCCWGMLLVVHYLLGWSTALVAAHPHIPAGVQVGWASWYGPGFHGRETASGERFSMHELTAAHRTLPLGTKVLVQNLETEAQVEVKITDRGPYVDPQHRIIDLSRAAADGLGLRERGVGPVRVVVSEEAAAPQAPAGTTRYAVQVGAFPDRAQAAEVLAALRERYPTAHVTAREGPGGRYHRVRVGPIETQAQARQLARALRQEGYAVFVDALATHRLPGSRLRRAGEGHLLGSEGVGGGVANIAARPLLPVGRTGISMLALAVVGVASALLVWTRQMLLSVQRRAPGFAHTRPLPGPSASRLDAFEGTSP